MKSVCFFNNKGGVGKTTLLCNVASLLSEVHGVTVCVVDCDPQCNTTQYVLEERRTEALLKVRPTSATTTVVDLLKPINRGEPAIASDLEPTNRSRFGFDLLPGHPDLALLEDRFSQAWINFKSGDLGGARQTSWNSQLRNLLHEYSYDVVLYDLGPSLGALNRSVMIGTDYFVTPMTCDIFSVAGIRNLSKWIEVWSRDYDKAVAECVARGWEDDLSEFEVRPSSREVSAFVGYTVQQYIAKSEGGERRPTEQYERIRGKIPRTISSHLSDYRAPHLGEGDLAIGDVPNMFSLVPMSQSAHSPIHKLQSRDGMRGGQYTQRDDYVRLLKRITSKLLKNIRVIGR